MKKMIMIMVDGFGVPHEGWENSIYAEFGVAGFAETLSRSIPLDAQMGVDGLPQSATGQTALFCGVNAPRLVGRHIQGFPGPTLREIIIKRNIFSELKAMGLNVAFANAYVNHTLAELAEKRMRSVTTIMTESTLRAVRTRADLLAGDAVYHDLTRATIAHSKDINQITPEDAAAHLANIARKHDFTLFEYFLTDKAGHKRVQSYLSAVIADFSAFFMRLSDLAADELALLLTSDHGNCESTESGGHTLNPVPLFFSCPISRDSFDQTRSLSDLLGFISNHFSERCLCSHA